MNIKLLIIISYLSPVDPLTALFTLIDFCLAGNGFNIIVSFILNYCPLNEL